MLSSDRECELNSAMAMGRIPKLKHGQLGVLVLSGYLVSDYTLIHIIIVKGGREGGSFYDQTTFSKRLLHLIMNMSR